MKVAPSKSEKSYNSRHDTEVYKGFRHLFLNAKAAPKKKALPETGKGLLINAEG